MSRQKESEFGQEDRENRYPLDNLKSLEQILSLLSVKVFSAISNSSNNSKNPIQNNLNNKAGVVSQNKKSEGRGTSVS